MNIRKWNQFGFLFMLMLMLFACSKEQTPEDAASLYVESWNELNFEKMYDQLSEETKESLDKETFIERYEVIYDGVRLMNLQVELHVPEEGIKPSENGEAVAEYEIVMETIAGELSFEHNFSLVKEMIDDDERWGIEWDPSMIFPSMVEGDKVRVDSLQAKRGEIVDRNGKGLAVNGKALSIGIVPERLPEDETSAFEKMAEILNLPLKTIEEKRNASWVKPDTFVPMTMISKEDDRLDSLLDIEGVTYMETDARIYPLKDAAAHLIGYVQEVNAEELEELKDKGYQSGDQIGKNGLEKVFEDKLRGKDGGRIYIMDEDGIEKEEIASQEPVHGETLTLTIDSNIQKLAFNELEGEAGTTAAIHPQTGEVLALVNSPSYDPNLFVLGISNEQWEALNEDPAKPLLNRFTSTYAPGSVFKPITGAIALDTGSIDKNTSIDVNGLKWQEDDSWGDYFITRVTDPGKSVDFQTAMVLSDNIYFAQAALKTGKKQFVDYAKQFGFDEALPFEYPIKTSKIIEGSFENDIQLADSGYGQGKVQMSILHTAIAYTPFLNDGNLLKPTLLKRDESSETDVWKKDVIKKETASFINNTLIQVVADPNGTGSEAKISGKQIAGKTGTSELKKSKDETGQENGFFIAYDSDIPELLIAMLIENVEERGGSKLVVPKVKKLFTELTAN
ncbi:penicillin-binding transpeptidase domain-containing protein [Pueribacillus sp. YX66]|uniref:penicillin-binding transpeptidase domain-containing protein n=1 Tax=Pueribacillus sp. YX66 TaxID=3229242 RepID=UPI00358D77EC